MVRYGGEEFLIVLPETKLKNAFQAAERLRDLVSRKIFNIRDLHITITASFGISGYEPSAGSVKVSSDILIGEADRYLYQAKKDGRNRVKGVLPNNMGE